MISAKVPIYGLFLTTVISLLIAITLLVLEIVFKYVGFVSSDFVYGTCINDTYINTKYSYLQYQLEVAFVGTCLSVLTLIIILVLSTLSAKNYYQLVKSN